MTTRSPPDLRAIAADYDLGAATFDARFARNERSRFRFRRIEAPLLQRIASFRRILDLGCGSGRILRDLGRPDAAEKGLFRTGVDLSQGLLGVARGHGLDVARADAHELPFGDGSFEAVVAANAVFRYLDYGRAVAECARVLAPGGLLGVHQYARGTALRARPDNPLHLGHPDELVAPARSVGLDLEEMWLWRGVRLRPYAVRLPAALALRLRLWDQVVLLFRRR